jgi:hypothetical protein
MDDHHYQPHHCDYQPIITINTIIVIINGSSSTLSVDHRHHHQVIFNSINH